MFGGTSKENILKPQKIRSGAMRSFYELWLSKRDGRPMPARQDFRLGELKPYLGWLSVFEFHGDCTPDTVFVRLVGTRIVEATGLDSTGKYLRQAVSPEHLFKRACKVYETRAPLYKKDVYLSWSPKNHKDYDVLWVPCSSDGKTVDRAFIHLEFEVGGK